MSEARFSSPERTWGLVLAGGVGSRFWPVSTPRRPKQLLPLATDNPLIRDAVDRLRSLVAHEKIRVLTRGGIENPILTAVPGLRENQLWVEPTSAGTGPALAWAAARIAAREPDAVMVATHADAAVLDEASFRDDVRAAVEAARRHGVLMTIGATPGRAETGYGYIEVGDPLGGGPARSVRSFTEKPDRETAGRYVDSGSYVWNTGIFVWRVADFLDEIRDVCPELAAALPLAEAEDHRGFFDRVEPISVDEGVLERSTRVGVIRGTFGWDDVGSWEALFRTRRPDEFGNVRVGDTSVVDGRGNALYCEQGRVIAFGVDDLIVVRTAETTLVISRGHAPELKSLLARLESSAAAPDADDG